MFIFMSLKLMPQEVEVWYLLPSLRKELARIFIEDYKLSQKETASILGVTESAVSQYVKSKRASLLIFSKTELDEVKKYADKIIKDRENSRNYFYELSKKLRGSKSMCELHKKKDPSLSKDCSLCHK